jgi:hypothetical protein
MMRAITINCIGITLLLIAFIAQAQSPYEQRVLNQRDSLDSKIMSRDDDFGRSVAENGGLNYFPIASDYLIDAQFILVNNAEVKTLRTKATNFTTNYIPYAILKFTMKGTACELTAFRDGPMAENKDYNIAVGTDGQPLEWDSTSIVEFLFLPFSDHTTGETTYGGGRYMDVDLSKVENDRITLDFNLCYNPSCAYYDNALCPIPPKENDLSMKVEAGVKAWKD